MWDATFDDDTMKVDEVAKRKRDILEKSIEMVAQRVAKLKEPIRITTANGEVIHDKRTSTLVRRLDQKLTNVVCGECPPVTSLGRFCIDDGMNFIW